MKWLAIYILVENVGLVYPCARTSDVGVTTVAVTSVPGTTVAGVTTTVPEATTTVPGTTTTVAGTTTTSTATTTSTTTASACGAPCAQDSFVATTDPTYPGSYPPDVTPGQPDANGCPTLDISCPTMNDVSILSFFDVNGIDLGQAGPNGQGNPATATLVCNTMMQWTFTAVDTTNNMEVTTLVASGYCV